MNTELVPVALAAGGGAGLVAAVAGYETQRAARLRADRARLGLQFPADMDPVAALAALRGLSGFDWYQELIFEVRGRRDRISHAMVVANELQDATRQRLAAALPGVRVVDDPPADGTAELAVKLYLPTPLVLHSGHPEHATRALLWSLVGLADDEEIILRWAVTPTRPRARLTSSLAPDDREQRAAAKLWQTKIGGAGFQVAGLLLVKAGGLARARQLAAGVVSAVRARKNRVGDIRPTYDTRGARSLSSLPRVNRSSGWLSLEELTALLAWPLGDEIIPGVTLGGLRERLVRSDVPTTGRVLFVGRDGRGERPVALSAEAARLHVGIVGPTNSGKSALLGRCILQDIRAGFGGLVFDPKQDLVDDVLARVDPRDADRIVVLDPADARPSPALDVFGAGDPDLAADVMLGTLAAIFPGTFGIRTEVFGRLALRTLAEVPGATIADMGRLFADDAFRRSALSRLSDPFVREQWAAYEALSPAARVDVVQSPMSKVTALVSRPALRQVLAAERPTIDLGRLFAERKWLFVSASPGRLGELAARFLSAVVMYVMWSAIEARASLPQDARHPIYLYIDELTTAAALPVGLAPTLERARGLGAGITLAAQSLARVPESVRTALLSNVGTLMTSRVGADEAARIARELPGMTPRDLQALGRYEVASRVSLGKGAEVTVATGRTLPWPDTTGMAERIRDLSADRYGAAPSRTPDERRDEHDEATIGRRRRRAA